MIVTAGFTSAYKSLNNKEPLKTFHNNMIAPYKDEDLEGTFDYIL
jgi:hypothetical protein